MNKLIIASIGVWILSRSILFGQVLINEIFVTNASREMDNAFYNYSGWLELYNAGSTQVTIGGWALTRDSTYQVKWTIPTGTTIPAKGFLRVWTDKRAQGLHASFKLDGDGGMVALLRSSGSVEDKVIFGKQPVDVSYGRKPDGSGNWEFFHTPTPAATNNTVSSKRTSGPVLFSSAGGFYTSSFNLSLLYPFSPNVQIRYTIDGSEPNPGSAVYAQAIPITKTTIVRARAFEEGAYPGDIVSHTFFVNTRRNHLPVISIASKPDHFFNNTIGIYVDGSNGVSGNCSDTPKNWNRDWERPVNVELFRSGDKAEFSQMAGAKIFGGCSRGNPLKSMSMNARDDYGRGSFRYRLFEEKELDQFDSFVLRNSGNDMNQTFFRDALIQQVIRERMNVDYQAYQPAVVYINGQYWGMLNMREKLDANYVKRNYGLDRGTFDMLEGNAAVIEGTSAAYKQMINHVSTKNMAIEANFDLARTMIDLDNFLDYQIAQIYAANTDWPGNNIKYWKGHQPGYKWRWMIYDTDFGFGIWNKLPSENTISFALQSNGPSWPNPPWSTLLLRRLMMNPWFKQEFINRMAAHAQTTFNPTRVATILDSIKGNIEAEMPYHLARWGGSVGDWNNKVNYMKSWTSQRPDHVLEHLRQYFALGPLVSLKINGGEHVEAIILNGCPVGPGLFEGKFFGQLPVRLQVHPATGYRFKEAIVKEIAVQNVTVLPRDDTWRYHEDGLNLGTSWREPGYNDSSWPSGKAKLGYGDGDESTVISYGSNSQWKHVTAYFRKDFTLENLADFESFTLRLLRDDGAVVYLNGVEVVRDNMPAGEIKFDTFSTTYHDDNFFVEYTIGKEHFNEGQNLLAVEVHQASRTSSDLGFNLELAGKKVTSSSTQTVYTKNEFTLVPTGDTQVELVFEHAPVLTGLVINEVAATNTSIVNDLGLSADWFEVHNTGIYPVDIAGLFVTNNLNNRCMWKVLHGYEDSTTIPAGGYLVMWADKKVNMGPLHVDFKLNKAGGAVGLFQVAGSDTLELDAITYQTMPGNNSLSRIPDGYGPVVISSIFTPGEKNQFGVVSTREEGINRSIMVYPNPATDYLNIRMPEALDDAIFAIRDIMGRVHISQPISANEELRIEISSLPPGMYILELKGKNGHFHGGKFMKQ